MIARAILLSGILLSAINPGGCIGHRGPETAYQDFVSASAQRDWSEAWSNLSTPTRTELSHRAQQIAAFRHESTPKDGQELAFGDIATPSAKIARVVVANQSQDQATLQVIDDKGGTQDVHVVRESGVWKVDLTRELQAAAP